MFQFGGANFASELRLIRHLTKTAPLKSVTIVERGYLEDRHVSKILFALSQFLREDTDTIEFFYFIGFENYIAAFNRHLIPQADLLFGVDVCECRDYSSFQNSFYLLAKMALKDHGTLATLDCDYYLRGLEKITYLKIGSKTGNSLS